jgi:hypothetical protein
MNIFKFRTLNRSCPFKTRIGPDLASNGNRPYVTWHEGFPHHNRARSFSHVHFGEDFWHDRRRTALVFRSIFY